jgi:uncharacterized repeat protein (TIGR02543 family)
MKKCKVLLVLAAFVIVTVVFAACFSTVRRWAVTFNSMGGSSVASITVANGARIEKPADPTNEDYVFSGWFKDEERTSEWNFAVDTVTANITLYAKWTDAEGNPLSQFRVDFDTRGGSSIEFEMVNAGGGLLRPLDPTKNMYEFDGWYLEEDLSGSEVEFPLAIHNDTVLFAKWTARPITVADLNAAMLASGFYPVGAQYMGMRLVSINARYTFQVIYQIGGSIDSRYISIGLSLELTNLFDNMMTISPIQLHIDGSNNSSFGGAPNVSANWQQHFVSEEAWQEWNKVALDLIKEQESITNSQMAADANISSAQLVASLTIIGRSIIPANNRVFTTQAAFDAAVSALSPASAASQSIAIKETTDLYYNFNPNAKYIFTSTTDGKFKT